MDANRGSIIGSPRPLTQDALDGRGTAQVFGDSRDNIRNHLVQLSLTDCAVHEPQRLRRAFPGPRIDSHVDKELGIKLLRAGARNLESSLGDITLGIKEIRG